MTTVNASVCEWYSMTFKSGNDDMVSNTAVQLFRFLSFFPFSDRNKTLPESATFNRVKWHLTFNKNKFKPI